MVVATTFFTVFIYHGIYLAGILDALMHARENNKPFKYDNYEKMMSDKNIQFGCPAGWASCEFDHPAKFTHEITFGGSVLDALANEKIDAFAVDYIYGSQMMTQINETTGKNACEDIGYLPSGKKGWTEENVAGIIKKVKTGWVATVLMKNRNGKLFLIKK